jgi:predicted metallo-beta-lactamase superfamily hydrolase
MSGPFVYVGTFTIKNDRLEQGKKYLTEHCAVVEANEPRLIAFHAFFDEEGRTASVVQVHPDSASMEFHMQVMSEHLADAFDYIEAVVSEQYFGAASDALSEILAKYAEPGVSVTSMPVHAAGFTRSGIR